MTDITTIVKDAPTYSELADIAGELAARVQELEAILRDLTNLAIGQTPPSVLLASVVETARQAIGEGRP